MAMEPEALYRQLGRLMETMPNLRECPTTKEAHIWLGRAQALVDKGEDVIDSSNFRSASDSLIRARTEDGLRDAAAILQAVLCRVLGRAELQAPASAKGTFIPVGNSFDAFVSLSKVLQSATADVLIVDPYMDETALTDFAGAVSPGVMLRLMSDEVTRKLTFEPSAIRWVGQHGTARPLQVRLAPHKHLHDRAILIDKTTAWTLTQSLKDLAKHSPAEIVRADDIAPLKIEAYEEIWSKARIVV